MHLDLGNGVHWIGEYSKIGAGKYMPTAVYLLETDAGDILIDTGSHTHREPIRNAIEDVTGGDGVDAIIISHPDLPHSGNVHYFIEEWNNPKIVTSVATPPVVGLPERTRATIGKRTTVLGRALTFVDPPLADIVFSTWPYDHETGVLFSIDGFGGYTTSDERISVIETEADLPSVDDIRAYHDETFRWLEYVDPAKFRGALARPFSEFDVSYVAPTHGAPIAAEVVDEYLDRLTKAVESIVPVDA